MLMRKGEDEKTWFRSSRFFHINEAIYFSTREGTDIGPFKSQRAAERGLQAYIGAMKNKNTSGLYANRIALQGVWASTLYH